ncbi:MAG: RsmE family RNA methyltransferase [Acidobacteriota bacterium]|nr:RsmE family RNA methyltransferase [Acidobacteriota bacterium]
MTSNQFFIKKIPETGRRFFIEGQEHHHLCRVARAKPGQHIWLTDGHNRKLLVEIEDIDSSKAWLRPLDTVEEKISVRIILGLGLTKPATFDFIVQKATELGVSEIQPLITERSQSLPADEKLKRRQERWGRIAKEALKQCKGAILPEIKPPVELRKAARAVSTVKKIYLDESSRVYFRDILEGEKADAIYLMIGPEGGWTQDEIADLRAEGFKGLSLGGRILKTETAALAAISLISHFWNW